MCWTMADGARRSRLFRTRALTAHPRVCRAGVRSAERGRCVGRLSVVGPIPRRGPVDRSVSARRGAPVPAPAGTGTGTGTGTGAGTGRPVGALARWDSHCSVHGAVGDNGVRSQVRGSTENMMSRTVQINKHIVRRRRRQPSAVEPSGAAGARGGRRAARRRRHRQHGRPPRVHRPDESA